ncbi:unnamed protein product [Rhodiola kirilowii]
MGKQISYSDSIGRCSVSAFPVPKSFVALVMIPFFFDGMLGFVIHG